MRANIPRPVQLLIDMKVRWSSTYVMLDRAERKKKVWSDLALYLCLPGYAQCIDEFVDELRWEESDSAKRNKIGELKLNPEEWERVATFLSLLSVRVFDCGLL
jgi:hypothetical protein